MEPELADSPDAFRAEVEGEGANALFDYWLNLCDGRKMPRREEIDPVSISPQLLPWLYILTLSADGNHMFRLAGTRLDEIFSTEVSGKRISEVLKGVDLVNATRSYARVIEAACPWYSNVLYRVDVEFHVRYERLTLPIGLEGGSPDYLLGGIFLTEGEGVYEKFAEVFARGGLTSISRRELILSG